jgi:hypothetical protein
VQDKFCSFLHSEFYSLPPQVFAVESIVSGPRGWVNFNNSVVIKRETFDAAVHSTSSIAFMNLLSLILHEAKHGDLRLLKKDFNFHSPSLFPNNISAAEAGKMIERTMWNAKWSYPVSPSDAEIVAGDLLNRFHMTNDFSVKVEDKLQIEQWVSERPEMGSGGVDYVEIEYYK